MKVEELRKLQNLPLHKKISITKERIKEWSDYWDDQVYISFSGGKDSTVLLDIARKIYPDIKAVFIDTGLEWPEIRKFVKTIQNVDIIRPKMTFNKVIEKYGYPVVSKSNSQIIYDIRNTKSKKLYKKRLMGDENGNGKLPNKWRFLLNAPFKISHKCCDKIKKEPAHRYEKETKKRPIIGNMAVESRQRIYNYLQYGCNSFTSNRPISSPISFWLEKDIWDYIKKYNISYSDIYDKGINRTGCMFCMFGVHRQMAGLYYKNNFQIMRKLHPKKYEYCMNKLGLKKVLQFMNIKFY